MKPVEETKADRFRRLAEARVNKIIKMIRLLGNCSGKGVYQYNSDQVEQIFETLQAELYIARARFYQDRDKFSLESCFDLQRQLIINPHVTLKMPDGNVLTAVVFADGTYPAINVYSSNKGHDPELVCFAEFNPEHTAGQQLHIGVYQNDEEDTKYYAPYRKEES